MGTFVGGSSAMVSFLDRGVDGQPIGTGAVSYCLFGVRRSCSRGGPRSNLSASLGSVGHFFTMLLCAIQCHRRDDLVFSSTLVVRFMVSCLGNSISSLHFLLMDKAAFEASAC